MTVTGGRKALAVLWSGGIGDFLHYSVRFDALLKRHSLSPSEVELIVEATNPKQVRSLIERVAPEAKCTFVPPWLHWTKTNPLLDPFNERDRHERPAYRYAKQLGNSQLTDWFLPLFCEELDSDRGCLGWLNSLAADTRGFDVLLSARDKGGLWFPSPAVCAGVIEMLGPNVKYGYLGHPDEKREWMEPFVSTSNVAEMLGESCAAGLLIGTDTGAATARELLGLPNIYTVDSYWHERFMVRFGYWSPALASVSRSLFASTTDELMRLLSVINVDRRKDAALVRGAPREAIAEG